MRSPLIVTVLGLVLGASSTAAADAIESPPILCPPGTHGFSDHSGAGCAPSWPDDCPDGYLPGELDGTSYCSPPHASACPTGSTERSRGPDRPFCQVNPRCEGEMDCQPAHHCRPTGICIHRSAQDHGFAMRFADQNAYGECETEADCESGRLCDTSPRCDPDVHRVDPRGRTLPTLIRSSPSTRLRSYAVVSAISLIAAFGFVGLVVWWLRREKRPRAPR